MRWDPASGSQGLNQRNFLGTVQYRRHYTLSDHQEEHGNLILWLATQEVEIVARTTVDVQMGRVSTGEVVSQRVIQREVER